MHQARLRPMLQNQYVVHIIHPILKHIMFLNEYYSRKDGSPSEELILDVAPASVQGRVVASHLHGHNATVND